MTNAIAIVPLNKKWASYNTWISYVYKSACIYLLCEIYIKIEFVESMIRLSKIISEVFVQFKINAFIMCNKSSMNQIMYSTCLFLLRAFLLREVHIQLRFYLWTYIIFFGVMRHFSFVSFFIILHFSNVLRIKMWSLA